MTSKSTFAQQFKQAAAFVLMITVGLAIGAGVKYAWAWYQQPAIQMTMDTAEHFAKTNKKVVIYTAKWCPYCKKTKEYLTKNNIEYQNYDIESDDPASLALFKSLNDQSIPKTIIGTTVISGFHPELIEQVLKEQRLM